MTQVVLLPLPVRRRRMSATRVHDARQTAAAEARSEEVVAAVASSLYGVRRHSSIFNLVLEF